MFVHGLWLLPGSWDRWRTVFGETGYATLAPGWPDDPETVTQAREHPEVFAGKGIGEIADYEEAIIRRLDRKPVSSIVTSPCPAPVRRSSKPRLPT